jgi:DNA repair protein RadA/Sms
MSKSSSPPFHCTACGAQFVRWTGRCTECGKWSTVAAVMNSAEDARPVRGSDAKAGAVRTFASLGSKTDAAKLSSGHADLDRVLTGGFVAGEVILMGGEPGIGKSTLLAQAAIALSRTGKNILYVTGEESPGQVALRLKRLMGDRKDVRSYGHEDVGVNKDTSQQTPTTLGPYDPTTLPASLSFLDATDAAMAAATIRETKPDLAIVDSIQSMRLADAPGEAGGPSQVKASAAALAEAAKAVGTPLILAGQVTKDGELAGPRLLEHLVDTVLMLEGERQHRFRVLRALKHRFGPADETAVLAMTERGLEAVADPSAELLRDRPGRVPGSVVTCLLEGHRPLLLELQALVHHAGYGTPVRRATGFDGPRLGVLIAVLVRRAGIKLQDRDVYANAAGGLDAAEPAADLAMCLAIASAVSDVPVDPKTAACGEVGLGGEIRPIPFPDLRAKEAARHGFTTIVLPRGSKVPPTPGLMIIEAATLREAIDKTLGKA